MKVIPVEGQEREWQAYAAASPVAGLYHLLECRSVIEEVFGHRCHYRMAVADRVQGILPLVEMKSLLFGHFLVSMPFFNSGGIAAESPEAEAALASEAETLAARLRVRHVELRQQNPISIAWQSRSHKVRCVVDLTPGRELLFQKLSSRLRGKIRKAERAGARFESGAGELVSDFYIVFARNMRDLGTPVYSRTLFEAVLRHFADRAVVFVVRLEGKPVSAAIGLRAGGIMELPWICSNYDCANLYVNEYLYWSAMLWASENGLGELDLGRSSVDSGPHRFKKQWNPAELPLFWYYWLGKDAALPELNPANPKFRLAVRCWQNLPLAVAGRLGPAIVANIP
jgi:serine/alanine adding enzyme